jgi:hypothetical protein
MGGRCGDGPEVHPECYEDARKAGADPLWIVSGRSYTCGRDETPGRLLAWWEGLPRRPEREFGPVLAAGDRARLALLLREAWTAAEHPAHKVDPYVWADMFQEAGFVTDCRDVTAPDWETEVRLYRGCHPDWRLGMSWTDDLTVARWFANRHDWWGLPGIVVGADVPGHAVLARFVHDRREAEWVLDPWWIDEALVEEPDFFYVSVDAEGWN